VSYRFNDLVRAVTPPPVAQAQAWIDGRVFPPEMPLLDLSQAVPGYAPAAELAAHLAGAAREPATAPARAACGARRGDGRRMRRRRR